MNEEMVVHIQRLIDAGVVNGGFGLRVIAAIRAGQGMREKIRRAVFILMDEGYDVTGEKLQDAAKDWDAAVGEKA